MGVDIVVNPYGNVDWDEDGQYKGDHHIHWRGFGDEPADVIDVMCDGEELRGVSLPEEELYTAFGPGSQAEDEPPYWGTDEGGWTDMADEHSEFDENRDPEELGVDGVISYPAQEIDDVEHFCHLFATSTPQDFDYYPGPGGSSSDLDTLEEAVDEVLPDEDSVVIDGHGQVVIAHPSRYMDPVDDWDRYTYLLDEHSLEDGLLGFEIYTKSIGFEGWYGDEVAIDDMFSLWDSLLTEYMPDRPIWGFAANDCNTSDWGHSLGSADLRFWRVILSDDEFDPSDQQASQLALFDALEQGQFTISRRRLYKRTRPASAPSVPTFEGIDVDEADETITVDVSFPDGTGIIEWYSNGEVVETGETIELEEEHAPYVRCRAAAHNSSVVGNPDTDRVATIGDSTIGDVTFGRTSPIAETSTQPFGLEVN